MKAYNNNIKSIIKRNLNTKIAITINGDGSELFEYNLPQPHNYIRTSLERYTIEYYLHGDFYCTNKAGEYLNDILARFTLSMQVIEAKAYIDKKYKGNTLKLYDNNRFNSLRSIAKFQYKETVDNGKDNVFWAIKLYTEHLIKESGEGNLVAHSLIESFAFAHFIDRAKDKSTLKAKCRSIWNWYDARNWTIPKRYERDRKTYYEDTKMTRSEHMKNVKKKEEEANRIKVINAITGLMADEYKKKSGTWHIGRICEATNLSHNTVKKYIKEWELNHE